MSNQINDATHQIVSQLPSVKEPNLLPSQLIFEKDFAYVKSDPKEFINLSLLNATHGKKLKYSQQLVGTNESVAEELKLKFKILPEVIDLKNFPYEPDYVKNQISIEILKQVQENLKNNINIEQYSSKYEIINGYHCIQDSSFIVDEINKSKRIETILWVIHRIELHILKLNEYSAFSFLGRFLSLIFQDAFSYEQTDKTILQIRDSFICTIYKTLDFSAMHKCNAVYMLEHSLLEYYLEKNIIYNFSKEIKEGIMEKFQNNLTFTYLYNSHLIESSLHFKKDQELLVSIRKFLKQPELVKIIAQVSIEINKRVVKLLLTLEEEDPDFYNDLMYKYQSEKSKKELNTEFKTASNTLSKKLISVEEISGQLIQFLVDMKEAQNNWLYNEEKNRSGESRKHHYKIYAKYSYAFCTEQLSKFGIYVHKDLQEKFVRKIEHNTDIGLFVWNRFYKICYEEDNIPNKYKTDYLKTDHPVYKFTILDALDSYLIADRTFHQSFSTTAKYFPSVNNNKNLVKIKSNFKPGSANKYVDETNFIKDNLPTKVYVNLDFSKKLVFNTIFPKNNLSFLDLDIQRSLENALQASNQNDSNEKLRLKTIIENKKAPLLNQTQHNYTLEKQDFLTTVDFLQQILLNLHFIVLSKIYPESLEKNNQLLPVYVPRSLDNRGRIYYEFFGSLTASPANRAWLVTSISTLKDIDIIYIKSSMAELLNISTVPSFKSIKERSDNFTNIKDLNLSLKLLKDSRDIFRYIQMFLALYYYQQNPNQEIAVNIQFDHTSSGPQLISSLTASNIAMIDTNVLLSNNFNGFFINYEYNDIYTNITSLCISLEEPKSLIKIKLSDLKYPIITHSFSTNEIFLYDNFKITRKHAKAFIMQCTYAKSNLNLIKDNCASILKDAGNSISWISLKKRFYEKYVWVFVKDFTIEKQILIESQFEEKLLYAMSCRLYSFLLFVIKYKYPELLAYINVAKNLIRLYPKSSICISLPFSDLDPFAIIKVEFETKQVEKLRISVNVPQGYINEKIGTKIKRYRIQLNKTINLRSNVNTMRGLPANIIHTMDALLAFKVSFICAQKNIFIGYIHDCIIVSPSDWEQVHYILREQYKEIIIEFRKWFISELKKIQTSTDSHLKKSSNLQTDVLLLLTNLEVNINSDLKKIGYLVNIK